MKQVAGSLKLELALFREVCVKGWNKGSFKGNWMNTTMGSLNKLYRGRNTAKRSTEDRSAIEVIEIIRRDDTEQRGNPNIGLRIANCNNDCPIWRGPFLKVVSSQQGKRFSNLLLRAKEFPRTCTNKRWTENVVFLRSSSKPVSAQPGGYLRKGQIPCYYTFTRSSDLNRSNVRMFSTRLETPTSRSTRSSGTTELGTVEGNSFPKATPMERLQRITKTKGRYKNLIKNSIADAKFLRFSYNFIKNNPGNTTPAGSKETMDRITDKWFEETAKKLREGKYRFSMRRRVEIPKAGTNDKRTLIIHNARDQIVLKALQVVLEQIYEINEKLFSVNSHGFRLGKGCHSALKAIKVGWRSIPWYVSCDIEKAFPTIAQNRLLNIIRRHINDEAFINLIDQALKTEICSPIGVIKEETGVPQGSVLSPILSNIYFNELDQFIQKEIIEKYKKGTRAPACPEYVKATKFTADEKRKSKNERTQILQRKRKAAHKQGLRYSIIDDSYIRVRYVRYADDFLIGVRANKKIAIKIQNTVAFFIESSLNMKVSKEKSRLMDSYSTRVPFLGMLIHNVGVTKLPYRRSREIEMKKRQKVRVLTRLEALHQRNLKNLRYKIWEKSLNDYKCALQKGSLSTFKNKLENEFKKGLILIKDPNAILGLTSRQSYRKFIEEISEVSDIKNKERTREFLEIWRKELEDEKVKPDERWDITEEKEQEDIPLSAIGKHEILEKIAEYIKKNIDNEAYPIIKGWARLIPKEHELNDKNVRVWDDNFQLSPEAIKEVETIKNKEYVGVTKRIFKYTKIVLEDLIRQQETTYKYWEDTKTKNERALAQLSNKRATKASLPPQIHANTEKIKERLKLHGFLNSRGQPIGKGNMILNEPTIIIKQFNSIAYGLLSYYRCVDNLNTIKNIINYKLRFSLLYTLMQKHRYRSLSQTIAIYSEKISAKGRKDTEVSFINRTEVTNFKTNFLIGDQPTEDRFFGKLNTVWQRTQRDIIDNGTCTVIGCNNTDIEIHHIRKLNRMSYTAGKVFETKNKKGKVIKGASAYKSALNRKQIPLCSKHHDLIHTGQLDKNMLSKNTGKI